LTEHNSKKLLHWPKPPPPKFTEGWAALTRQVEAATEREKKVLHVFRAAVGSLSFQVGSMCGVVVWFTRSI
jgi:hypothetical protein